MVSKQNDPSRVVTSAAYLLFYRRRSEVPLGGPRFQEIFDSYNNQPTDAEMSDSGEGQRLGQGSSPRGSSSALIGAGPTLRSGSGLASAHSANGTFASNDGDSRTDGLPSYMPMSSGFGGLDNVVEDDADAEADGSALQGFHHWRNESALRRSIEQDEGVDMAEWGEEPSRRGDSVDQVASALSSTWTFRNLDQHGGGRAGSEADNASMELAGDDDDIDSTAAQGDGSSSIVDDMEDEEANFGGPYPRHVGPEDFQDLDLLPAEPGVEYTLPDEPQQPVFEHVEQPPPYDATLSSGRGIYVTADDITGRVSEEDVADSRVTEIHITDDDDIPDVAERGRSRERPDEHSKV